ncbi:MAG TPA: hypothetical protein VGG37_01815 [Opitutaceae bacterium]|jgi:hypothetical protein
MTVEFAYGDAGDGPAGIVPFPLPLLKGEPREPIGVGVERAGREGSVTLWRGPGLVVGCARIPGGRDLEASTGVVYADLLRACRGLHLYRIWNCVPGINALGRDGMENYRAFCRARSMAFERAFGDGFQKKLPSASAVGTSLDDFTVAFVAGDAAVRHFENPVQVPAYEYPSEHGPRSPSFARATSVKSGLGLDLFVSGTSSVVGHRTVAPGDTSAQLACTLENLRLISSASGMGDRFAAGSGCRRHFKVYLRHPEDLRAISAQVGSQLLAPGDRVTYLRADICRADLNVEIEVTVRGAERS